MRSYGHWVHPQFPLASLSSALRQREREERKVLERNLAEKKIERFFKYMSATLVSLKDRLACLHLIISNSAAPSSQFLHHFLEERKQPILALTPVPKFRGKTSILAGWPVYFCEPDEKLWKLSTILEILVEFHEFPFQFSHSGLGLRDIVGSKQLFHHRIEHCLSDKRH